MEGCSGVVGPGETLIIVVPDTHTLVVAARMDLQKRDDVFTGKSHVRFTTFVAHTTPELTGKVEWLSDDVETDEKTAILFHRVRLSPDALSVPLVTNKLRFQERRYLILISCYPP